VVELHLRGARRQRTPETEWIDDPWDEVDETWFDDLEPARPNRRWIGLVLACLAIVAVIAVLLTARRELDYVRQLNPPGEPGPPVNFTVTDDDTLQSLADRLQAEGLILDADVFLTYVERNGGIELVPGYYSLRTNDHVGNLMAVLRTPPGRTFTNVVFPEGFTVAQMAARLADRVPGASAERFLELATTDGEIRSAYQPDGVTSLEGLLFPDTYQVAGDETETSVIERMVGLMERVGRQEGLDDAFFDPYDVLIVASMIEKEAKLDEDRGKIARVIYNRLFMGMPLQIDATLFYGQDPDIPFSVLRQLDTPYNTYLNTGLPPTPIANPGRASIRAALNPTPDPSPGDPICTELPQGEPCRYLYYVLIDTDGRHAFAATLEQHERNIEIAREAGVL
jgi:UPF0755 protein